MKMPSAITHLDLSPVSASLVTMATVSTALQVDWFCNCAHSSHLLRPIALTNSLVGLFIVVLNTTKAISDIFEEFQ